jgi:cell division topological specificity factor
MGLLDRFRRCAPKNSAAMAKERLQILVAHDRVESRSSFNMGKLQQEILEVIKKYFDVEQDAVSVNLEQDDSREILELNIVLPDNHR